MKRFKGTWPDNFYVSICNKEKPWLFHVSYAAICMFTASKSVLMWLNWMVAKASCCACAEWHTIKARVCKLHIEQHYSIRTDVTLKYTDLSGYTVCTLELLYYYTTWSLPSNSQACQQKIKQATRVVYKNVWWIPWCLWLWHIIACDVNYNCTETCSLSKLASLLCQV